MKESVEAYQNPAGLGTIEKVNKINFYKLQVKPSVYHRFRKEERKISSYIVVLEMVDR